MVQIINLEMQTKKKFIPKVVTFIGGVMVDSGMNSSEVKMLQSTTELLLIDLIENGFENDESSKYEISINSLEGKIIIAIQSRAKPFYYKKNKNLLNQIADDIKVNFFNLGIKGIRIEFSNNKLIAQKEKKSILKQSEQENLSSEEVILRMMEPADIEGVITCFYKTYGYSYGWDLAYVPEKMKKALRDGFLTSCVYVNSRDEIVAHFGMMRHHKLDRICETGMAVTDPEYRGRGFFKNMKLFMAKQAKKSGILGFYSEATAKHAFSQKGNISIGAKETGLFLGLVPENVDFKAIKVQESSKRQAAVLYYLKLNEGDKQKIYLPAQHKAIIQKIYDHIPLQRTYAETGKTEIKLSAKSVFEFSLKPELGIAFCSIKVLGIDLQKVIKQKLHELCVSKFDLIYIDLPLSDPACQQCNTELEKLGFFFAGIIPELANGDVLRLQYLNNLNVETTFINTVSEFGNELKDYVCAAYNLMLKF